MYLHLATFNITSCCYTVVLTGNIFQLTATAMTILTVKNSIYTATLLQPILERNC